MEFRNYALKGLWKLKYLFWNFTLQEQKDIAALEARLYVSETAKDRSSHILWAVFVIAIHKFSFSPWQHNGISIEKTNLLKHFEVCQINSLL